MKTLVATALLLFSVNSFATTEVYCQFWNSITHTPEGRTLKGEFPQGSTELLVSAEQSINPKSFEAMGFTMKFVKVNATDGVATKFVAELWQRYANLKTAVLAKYERNLAAEKVENFILTSAVDGTGGTYYISALCSPQN